MTGIDAELIATQIAFSSRTFGPGRRTEGILDHMTKEQDEIRKDPDDLEEWIDQLILSIDGAWRTDATPEEIIECYKRKLAKNMMRKWPDWRTAEPGKAIEHDRTGE